MNGIKEEAIAKMPENKMSVEFIMDRKTWVVTHSAQCYHAEECSHVDNTAKKQIRSCAYEGRANDHGGRDKIRANFSRLVRRWWLKHIKEFSRVPY